MAISETKMQMVIANYFKDECDVNTSIRQAFEKGFRIGVKKGASTNRPQGEWIVRENYGIGWYQITCSECGEDVTAEAPCIGYMPIAEVLWDYCPYCGARMKGADDETAND